MFCTDCLQNSPGVDFFLILSARTKTFLPTLRFSCGFFFFFFSLFFFSILSKLKSVLDFQFNKDFLSMSLGLSPYFSFNTLFMLSAEVNIIFVGVTFIFSAFNFAILLLSSHIFCSAANVFLPLTELVNISTLFLSFKSLIFTC